jgi:pimeloyl-ACP methyl ester carboxylesterase
MLSALLCLALAAPTPPAAPVNGWTAAQAPNKRVLSFDLSRLDEGKLLRGGKRAALYALGDSAADYHRERVPVILVHGIRGAPKDLQAVATRLKATLPQLQLHVLAYDGWHRRTHESGNDFAEELRTLQKSLGADREIVIVAHSMGGLVSRWALNELSIGPGKGVEKFKRVRLLTLDSPWHGYGGPSDRGIEGWFMAVARAFIPDALEDMRARSAMFQGDPKSKDPAAREGLLNGILPTNVEVEVVFAQEGTDIWDYTEGPLVQLAPKLQAYFTDETPVRGDPWLVNFWNALIQARAYIPFQEELRALGDKRMLVTGHVRAALLKHYPRFPGDHVGVLKEHPGQRSALDWLCEQLKAP